MYIETCKFHVYCGHFWHLEKTAPSSKYVLCMSRLVLPSEKNTTTESWDGGQLNSSSSHARSTSKISLKQKQPFPQFVQCSKLELDIPPFLSTSKHPGQWVTNSRYFPPYSKDREQKMQRGGTPIFIFILWYLGIIINMLGLHIQALFSYC